MPTSTIARLVAAATILGALAGCSRAPKLTPRLILQTDQVGQDFWLAAPYVLAVKITKAELLGRPEPIFDGGPKTLQLIRFAANVENVIKGDLPDKTIAFFFFVKLDQNPPYYLYPGRRYIISLRREGTVLRSWADATQLKIDVFSGSHRQKDLPLDRGPVDAITYILLTPGEDCDLTVFSNRLEWPLLHDSNPMYISDLLKQLQLHSNPRVRDSACLAEAQMFGYHPACLDRAVSSPDPSIRRAAKGLLQQAEANGKRLLENPFWMFPTPWTDNMVQWFELYTEDVRPEVRRTACDALRLVAPHQSFKNCK